MKSKHLLSTLTLAISAAVGAQEVTKLEAINVNIGQEGAKNKTNVVNVEILDKRTDSDLRGALREEPSINFGGGNGTSQWLTIRGIGQDQVDLKVDNVYSDTQMFHHQGRFMLDPSLVKIVSVQKGTGSASAGIGATAGAIVAKTLSASDLLQEGQPAGGKVSAGYFSNKGHQLGLTGFGKFGAFDGLVATNFINRKDYQGGHGYHNQLGQRHVLNSGLKQRGILAKIGADINEDHRVDLSLRQERDSGVRALREEFDFSQTLLTARNGKLTEAQEKLGYTVEAGTNLIKDKNGRYVANIENNSPRYRIATQNTVNLEYEGRNMGFIDKATANIGRLTIKRDEPNEKAHHVIETYNGNLNLESAFNTPHLFKYGVNWRYQEGKSSGQRNSAAGAYRNQNKTDIGLYGEGIWSFHPVTLTTGLRYDHFNFKTTTSSQRSHGRFNPSIGLIYDVNPDLSFNVSHNYASRSPRLYEVVLGNGRAIRADKNLKAERAQNTEIGFDYNWNDQLSLEGSYFWQTTRGIISTAQENAGQPNAYYRMFNGGKLKNSGYELGATYRWEGLKLGAGVAYSKPKLNGAVADNNYTAIPVGRTWTARASYQFEPIHTEIGWRGRFVENGGYTNPSRGSSGSDERVERPGYGVSDFYANWEPRKNLNVNFSINNAFNKNYRSHSQRAGSSTLAEAGRDVRLNFNYSF